jgi:hypothetical protein
MMLSMSQNEMQVMAVALRQNYLGPFSYREDQKFMMPDFRQPDFYGDICPKAGGWMPSCSPIQIKYLNVARMFFPGRNA